MSNWEPVHLPPKLGRLLSTPEGVALLKVYIGRAKREAAFLEEGFTKEAEKLNDDQLVTAIRGYANGQRSVIDDAPSAASEETNLNPC